VSTTCKAKSGFCGRLSDKRSTTSPADSRVCGELVQSTAENNNIINKNMNTQKQELKKELCELQQKLIAFQTMIANTHEEGWDSEAVEEVQNVINIINNYAK
jgi:hypothetical protein